MLVLKSGVVVVVVVVYLVSVSFDVCFLVLTFHSRNSVASYDHWET